MKNIKPKGQRYGRGLSDSDVTQEGGGGSRSAWRGVTGTLIILSGLRIPVSF